MKEVFIERSKQEAAVLPISIYPWGGDYRPITWAKIWFEEHVGFHVVMHCEEENPRAVYENPDEPVYEDSCMECFLQFYPDSDDFYINFEVNSKGVMLCQRGMGRGDRVFIRMLRMDQPEVTVSKTETDWEISYIIPLSFIRHVYGHCDFVEGQVIRGNFYKCGDKTEVSHYGCWSEIRCENPDYHRPEYFGKLILK